MNNNSTVALEYCGNYEAREVQAAVDKLFDDLGGIKTFVKPGQSVLIKPNLLTDRPPEQAVTTHPEVVRAIIRILKQHGAVPFVADSPANVVKIEKVWEKTGFKAMCEQEQTPLVSLEKSGVISYEVDGFSFTIAKPVLDADVIVNVPKIKTHTLTTLTGAVKNMFGTVPGFQKMNLHKLHSTVADFGKLIAVIYRHVPPHLNIADAVIAMHGEGPSAGQPIRLKFLAASRDAVAMDQTICHLLKINPLTVPYLRYLSVVKPNEETEDQIETVGMPTETLSTKNFIIPSTMLMHMIPQWLVNLLAPFVWIAPIISDKCIKCGRCIEGCPTKALSSLHKHGMPVMEQKKCTGCCCCHEVCPVGAITMQQSPLLNFVRRGKFP
ncbi:MAG: hypothetical protein A2283_03625 [Lentisphaerae bacterium RIFOXYA12_FULL_48_11]|nr:MAG: hypothetical protein A2283_03625 [Lentisphaerae bacterium RIFOXYA12_FULL_48_11]